MFSAVIKTALRELNSFPFIQPSNSIDLNCAKREEKKLLFIMNFVGLLTTFLFVGAIIYGIVGSQLDNVYMESVIVQSPVLRILSRNHTRIPSVAIN